MTTQTSDITQINMNYAAACEAILAIVPDAKVTVDETAPYTHHRWGVTVLSDSRGNLSSSGATFDVALARVLERVAALPVLCPVCGGRTDGPCAHSH